MKKIKDLENLIERNRALPETRLQATLSYEHFTIGPIPGIHLNLFKFLALFCRGQTIEEREILFCRVENYKVFNTSVISKHLQLLEESYKIYKKEIEVC